MNLKFSVIRLGIGMAALAAASPGGAAVLISDVAALEACLESGSSGEKVACTMDAGSFDLGLGLSVDVAASFVTLSCPFGPSATVFTFSGSGTALSKASGSGKLDIQGCALRDTGSASNSTAAEGVSGLTGVRIEDFDDPGDVGFKGSEGSIRDSSISATTPIDASATTGKTIRIDGSVLRGEGWCILGYDSGANNPQLISLGNRWVDCKGFQVRTEGTWHMIDDEGLRLGSGSQVEDAVFNGSANDFRVRIRARGAGAIDQWNSQDTVLIYWRTEEGAPNSDDATSFDFELHDSDGCSAMGLNFQGARDSQPVLEWAREAEPETYPTFHRFRLAVNSDVILGWTPGSRHSCDRPSPFGADLLMGWTSSVDGHRTQGVYIDSLWRIEVKDGRAQRVLPNVGQMSPPRSCDWNFADPGVPDDGDYQCVVPSDARLARVSCSTTGGTADINLYERAPGSPNAGNTGMLLADLVCDPDGEAVECDPTGVDLYDCSAVFLDDRLSQDALLTLGIKAVAAPPGGQHLRVHAEWY